MKGQDMKSWIEDITAALCLFGFGYALLFAAGIW